MTAHRRRASSATRSLFGRFFLLALLALAAFSNWPGSTSQAQGTDPCAPPNGNPVKCENALPGNPKTEWDIDGAGDPSIQGFATDISVNRGQTVQFKIDTNASAYRLDIYRLGYYAGLGARKVATVMPSASLPQSQPDCISDLATGLVDCGNWGVSASWAVPSTAVSGVYVAKLVRIDNGGASHIVFVVRNDASQSDILFQTADTTWQAYNQYGGNSLYLGAPAGRAYKVSYNRPFTTREALDGYGRTNWLFWGEYPMIRFLEANGYDVSYFSGVDADRRGALIANHQTYMTAGHDEYWSGPQWTNVQNALNAGVHYASFAGNHIYWKTRFESAIDGSGTAYRTLVSYKETLAAAKIDPSPEWTGTWRDPRFSPPSDGGRPENSLTGSLFTVNRGPEGLHGSSILVPHEFASARLWRNTSIQSLQPGETAALAWGTLGYEYDSDLDNGARPGGLIRLSSTTEAVPDMLLTGYGGYEDFGPGVATHNLVLHKKPSGALVFSAGTVQWSWGLDPTHDGGATIADVRMQQATVNQLADMGVQPTTLIAGVQAATASQDATLPVSAITYPTLGQQLSPGVPVTIAGTATDAGGGIVAAVEVSLDGGASWRPATGKNSWTFNWTPTSTGSVTIAVRAVDDSANIQAPATSIAVSVQPDTQAPTVTGRTPAPGATGVSAGTSVTVTFNEPMSVASISASTFELRTPGNQLVSSTVTYDSATRTATLRPASTLAFTTAYTARVRGGQNGVKDFSGNPLAADVTWAFTTWAAPPCPCTLWAPSVTPNVIDSADGGAYELGVRFTADYDGFITGLRFYKSAANTGTHQGKLWRADGTLIGSLTFSNESASGWQEEYFAAPVAVTANTQYIASYHAPNGHYSIDSNYFGTTGLDNSPLRAPGGAGASNGVFKAGSTGFPTESFNAANYWVDAIFLSTAGDTSAPTVAARVPAAGAVDVSAGSSIKVTFSEAMQTASVSASAFDLRNAASQAVPFSVTYSNSTRVATLQPTSSLAFNAPYTVTVKSGSQAARDLAGNTVATDVTWSFTTAPAPNCPCSLFLPTDAPTTPASSDTNPYELGVRFTAELDGYITAIRFYRGAGNTATTVKLWSSSGSMLASASLPSAGGEGWQSVALPQPVAVTANTTYVASYFAPAGRYAFDPNYFASGVTRSPLAAPAAASGGNGVFRPGSTGFPTDTYNAANYWVDVVYLSAAGDSVAPSVVSRWPAANSTNISLSASVTATFNEPLAVDSVTQAAFELRNAASQLVPASVHYDPSAWRVVLNPITNLVADTTYTARLVGGAPGVTDAFGNALATDVTWSFSVGAAPSCPCSIWNASTSPNLVDSGDSNAYELGVKFRPELDGVISGLRFYKSTANTGAHVGHLWTSTGDLLATVTFAGGTSSGWQEATLDVPVSVQAGVTYVASYWAPNGHYSVDGGYFASTGVTNGPLHALSGTESANGVFRVGSSGFPTDTYGSSNYWVDVVFVAAGAADSTPPSVVGIAPASNGTSILLTTPVVAQFSEAVQTTSVNGATFQLTHGSNQAVPAVVTYDAGSKTATLQPSAALEPGTTYTARLLGGTTGVKDLAGNVMTGDVVWTFTTLEADQCPCSLWNPQVALPTNVDSGDGSAIELGVLFESSAAGLITGMRFYKSAANTGQHTASLWTAQGTLLASAPFVAETSEGWQQVTFAAPVPVTAGTQYLASYHTATGHYAYDAAYFAAPFTQGPLTALTGRFQYGASSSFPSQSFNATNYWVDVIFERHNTTLLVSNVASAVTGVTALVSWNTNLEADSQVEYGPTASYGQSSTLSTARVTAHSVSLAGLVPDAIYNYRVRSRDANGRLAVSGNGTFSTDGTAPIVANVAATDVTATSAVIRWSTNEVADGRVEFGTTPSLGQVSATGPAGQSVHGVTLTALTANSTYYYRVLSRDASGNEGVSSIASFSTDVAAPVVTGTTASAITQTGATIAWSTNELADRQVEYGLTTSYGSTTTLQTTLSTSHSVSLTGLQTNRTYNYRVRSRDAAGNLTVSGNFTFLTDGTAPTVSSVAAVPGTTSATITWTTNEAADRQLEYGLTTSYGSTSTLQTNLLTSHSVSLSGLQTNRTYNYRIRTRDAAGNLTVSGNFTFATDSVAPSLTSIQAARAADGATITWNTNEASDTQVEFGLTTSYGTTSALQPALTTGHTVVLSGLQANRTYNYRVRSRDAAGNLAVSGNFTFITDVASPTISGVVATPADNDATIVWTTNEAADRQIEYGLTTSYGSTSTLQTNLLTSHSVTLTGLQTNRTYNYRIRTRDAAGNLTISGNFTFATDGTAPTISNIQESNITQNSARISWTTNELSDTQIQYSTSILFLSPSTTTLVTTPVTAHSQTITGLQRNRRYYYRVLSRDAAGNLATSSTGDFLTAN